MTKTPEINTRNANGFKNSCDCYRNIKIKGVKVKFEQWSIWDDQFSPERAKAKKLGLKTRMINGELFREVR